MRLLLAILLVAGAVAAGADVFYVEEVVNPGFGARKVGGRKTVNRVYIKGSQQKLESSIETDARTARALREQGQPLNASKILRLDANQVVNMDLDAQTYVAARTPPAARPVVPVPDTAATVQAPPANPSIDFAVRETGDSTRIAGILCRRVVARMRARYVYPQSGRPRRENRYEYDAWMARDFPGYGELRAFQQLQASRTSYPPLISGSLEQLRDAAEDYDQLVGQLGALEGFPMRSTIRVTVARPGQEGATEVFRLDREVKSFAHSTVPDSVFAVPSTLTRLQGR